MNWYKFLTETNKIHNDERPPDRLPMFQLVLREQGPLFKTVVLKLNKKIKSNVISIGDHTKNVFILSTG
jgi:hypothetical protein